MFDINIYDLSDLPNKVTYCLWRTGLVFNDTEGCCIYCDYDH